MPTTKMITMPAYMIFFHGSAMPNRWSQTAATMASAMAATINCMSSIPMVARVAWPAVWCCALDLEGVVATLALEFFHLVIVVTAEGTEVA